jgi:hypothetical protein
MPIEIRELVIKARVDEVNLSTNGSQNKNGGISDSEKEAIIAACLEQVFKALEEKNER